MAAETPAIIIDMDGTLADISHRRHHLEGRKDWTAFFAGIPDDPLQEWCREVIRRFAPDHSVLVVTGRPASYEGATRTWLETHGMRPDRIFFRRAGDFRADDEVKREIWKEHIQPHYRVLFVVDDRDRVVRMWREEGLVCLQCAPGDF